MKKKARILFFIVLSIIFCTQSMVFAVGGSADKMVNPTDAKVLVNGTQTAFEAYTIDGNNYFKLRDLAKVVDGTAKQFNVTYDTETQAINLISDMAYTEVGGELVAGNGQVKRAVLSISSIYKDGSLVQLTAYTIGDNNFFKLRDLMQVFNIGVTWDGVTSTIGVDTALAYVAPPVTKPVVKPEVGIWYTPKYQDAFATYAAVSFSEGFFVGNAPIIDDSPYVDTRIAIYDAQMKLVKMTDYKEAGGSWPGIFSDGLMSVTDGGDFFAGRPALYGYCDTTGKEVIPGMYHHVSNFTNGLALVHQTVDGEEKTLIINKKNEVLISWDDSYYGGIRPYAIYIDQADPLTEDRFGHGWYYDFNGKKITIEDRANTWDQYGYYDELGTRHDLTRYNGDEKKAFISKYENLYSDIKYQGGGFFIVENNERLKAVVDKNNKVIIPMQTGDINIDFTETSAIFRCNVGTYNASGKLIIDKAINNYSAKPIGHDALWISRDKEIWGLCSLDGNFIVPLSSTPLSYIDKDGYFNASGAWQVNPPPENITFYTTANMDIKGDTTELKDLFAKAKVFKNSSDYAESHPYPKNQFDHAYANAKKVLATSNPSWIDINSVKVFLSYF